MITRRRIVTFIVGLTTVLVAIYAVTMVVLAALWVVEPERTSWIALSNILAPHLFLPLIVVVPFAILFRSRTLRAMSGFLVILFIALFGSRLVPPIKSELAQQTSAPLRVVTFNQKFNNPDIEGSLAVLRKQQADIVALQELSTPMAEAIERDGEITTRFPYRWFQPAERSSGMGIMSRFPFTQLPASRELLMQAVAMEVAGQQFTFINAHPIAPALNFNRLPRSWLRSVPWARRVPASVTYNPRRRNEHLEALIADIDGRTGPLIVAGDFNTADRDPMYAELSARMRDVYRETGWGFGTTFPNERLRGRLPVPFPLVRIDYVWTRGDIEPLRADVVCDAEGSDHCMVVADVRVAGNG